MPLTFGILVTSDTCSNGSKIDHTGPELEKLITDTETETGKILKGDVIFKKIVKDNMFLIKEYLISWSDNDKVNVIITAGGTGFSERDVTPEATKDVIEKETPGLSIAMLVSSLQITPMAMLSRATCGIRKKTLIINLPGSPKAARECLTTIAPAIPHAVELIINDRNAVEETHRCVQSYVPHGCPHKKQNAELLNLENIAGRNRESPFPMLSVESAIKLIHEHAICGETETINVQDAHGRVLAVNVYSSCDLPPFRASIKDGYAVLASDGKGRRYVLGGLTAGTTPESIKLSPGTCVRVNTGAPIPDDATAVVQVEDTKLIEKTSDNMEEKEIEIMTEPKEGQDIRPIGCDIEKGSLVLKSCTKIGAAEMGLLAACGCTKVTVIKLPKIGVLSTGDELQAAGEPLIPGHVYDSNKVTLMSILKENGFNSNDLGIAKDNATDMLAAITNALVTKQVDVLITSGSVSMGEKDMLKPILEKCFNATIHFGRVNMKPGKPTTFATCIHQGRKKYFLCLPGNPVSATVTSYLFVLPLLNHLHGIITKPVLIKAKLTMSYNLDPRPEYARVILDWSESETYPLAYSTGNQISSKLLSCRNANALLMLPGRTAERTMLKEGEIAQAMLLGIEQRV